MYIYENIHIIFIAYITCIFIKIFDYVNLKNLYKEFKLYQTQVVKLDKNITT